MRSTVGGGTKQRSYRMKYIGKNALPLGNRQVSSLQSECNGLPDHSTVALTLAVPLGIVQGGPTHRASPTCEIIFEFGGHE